MTQDTAPQLPQHLAAEGYILTTRDEIVFYKALEEGYDHPDEILLDDHRNDEVLEGGYYEVSGTLTNAYAVVKVVPQNYIYLGAGLTPEEAIEMAVHNHKCRKEWLTC